MRKLYTTKLINRPEMKFYLVIDYTLPSTWLKSTQAEIQNDGGSLGLVISLKTRSRLSHLIKRESLMFSLRQYCLDFLIFTTKDSKFHFSPTFTSNLFFSIHEFAHRALWFLPFCLLPGAIHWTVHLLLVFVGTFAYGPRTSFFMFFTKARTRPHES